MIPYKYTGVMILAVCLIAAAGFAMPHQNMQKSVGAITREVTFEVVPEETTQPIDYGFTNTSHIPGWIDTETTPTVTPALWNDTRATPIGFPNDVVPCCEKPCKPIPSCEFPWWCGG